MLPLSKHLHKTIKAMTLNLFDMLTSNGGKFSQQAPAARRPRTTVDHPEFPEIKNFKQATLLVVNTWNLKEGVWSRLLHEDEVEMNQVLEPCSKYMIQERLEETGFGSVKLDSISSYLSVLHKEGLVSLADMKDLINGKTCQSMYCSNEDLRAINGFHQKFSNLLNSMTGQQLENFTHNHNKGRFSSPF